MSEVPLYLCGNEWQHLEHVGREVGLEASLGALGERVRLAKRVPPRRVALVVPAGGKHLFHA